MDKAEVANTNLKSKNKFNHAIAVGASDKNYNNELHGGTTEKYTSNSSTKPIFQNSDVKKKRSTSLNIPDKTEGFVSISRSAINSRSISQIDSVNNNLKTKHPNNKWSYLDCSKSSFSTVLAHAISMIRTDNLPEHQDETNSHFCESILPSKENESMLPVNVKNVDTSAAQMSMESSSSCERLEDDIDNENKCRILSPTEKKEDFPIKPTNEGTNGQYTARTTKKFSDFTIPVIKFGEDEENPKPKDVRTSVTKDEYLQPDSLSLKSHGSSLSSPDSEESKVELDGKNEENSEDASVYDFSFLNYIERPQLPLKPLQKRSRSCTNIVQTIRGLSKRKTSGGSNRLSSPDHTLTHRKELSISEANISRVPRKQSTEAVVQDLKDARGFDNVEYFAQNASRTAGVQPCQTNEQPAISRGVDNQEYFLHDIPRGYDNQEYFTIKDIRPPLNSYAWYHLVDAKEGSKRLLNMRQNGAFLIRPASNPTSESHHTLCVVYAKRVFNFHIRTLTDGRITLGKAKTPEKTFSTLLEMIKFHQSVPIPVHFAGELGFVHLLITPSKQGN